MLRSIPSTARTAARRTIMATPRRTFIRPTAVRMADLVQDIYLKELQSYKPRAIKPGDEKGVVHEFKAPKTPASPEESNIANDLKAYEDQEVEVEGQVASADGEVVEEDWFEEEPEDEEVKH